jgi:hypothetical protein
MAVQSAHPLATHICGNAVLRDPIVEKLERTGKMDAEALGTGNGCK